jgi:predicted negative regulator of RcsB-dependent stress response
MASHLDLEEQEQLDDLKAFWKQYGNLISWVLVLALGGFAAWNGWNYYLRDQGAKAGALYDEIDRAALALDSERATRIFADMRERYPRAVFTQQAGLIAARVAAEKGQYDAARASLGWVAESGGETEYRAVARLRLAGLLLDLKRYDEALKQLDGIDGDAFAALAADRRGDIFLAEGKSEDAKAAYQKAWAAMDPKVDYRRLIEAKLNLLGVQPAAAGASAAEATK